MYLYKGTEVPELDLPTAQVFGVGGKGAGLLRLPPTWYPPSIYLAPVAFNICASDVTKLGRHIDLEELIRAISYLSERSADHKVIVRSSADGESITERGQYLSLVADGNLQAVLDALSKMWSTENLPGTGKDVNIGALLQPFIKAKLRGHMSNEYRVSRDSASWHVSIDYESRSGEIMDSERTWRVINTAPAGDVALRAATVELAMFALRSVASRFSALAYRYHIEWVWDGTQVWIVQADRVPPDTGKAPGESWAPRVGSALSNEDLKLWRSAEVALTSEDSEAVRWNKLAVLSRFRETDLPAATIWTLFGRDNIQQLAAETPSDLMVDDLRKLCSGHIVIRTDLTANNQGFLLPTSDCISEVEDALDFLVRTTRELVAQGIGVDSVAFLAHRFIRARVSAWTRASPNSSVVRVDSIWGMADGLSWLQHDTAWVNASSGSVRRTIGGKTAMLDVGMQGTREYRRTPTEWVWRGTLSDDQLRTLALGASRLARQTGSPSLTMWFVGLLDGSDAECLPWFETDKVADDIELDFSLATRPRVHVCSEADLARAASESIRLEGGVVWALTPEQGLFRDVSFLQEIISSAKSSGAAIELSGSPLAHPYYIFSKAGIPVVCQSNSRLRPKIFDKLVRDNIPGIAAADGEEVVSFVASNQTRDWLLRVKLVEEAVEACASASVDELITEIADIEEVIRALRRARGITREAVRRRADEKRLVLGGFNTGRVLRSTNMEWEPGPGQVQLPMTEEGAANTDMQLWHSRSGKQRTLLNVIPALLREPVDLVVRVGNTFLMVTYTKDGIVLSERDPGPVSSQQSLFEVAN